MGLTYKKVLVAVDGSRESEWALKKAIEVCRRNDADLVITHIIDLKQFASISAYDFNISQRSEEYGEQLLAEYKNLAIDSGIKNVITDLEYGSPKVKIAKEIAPKHNAELIICGATGLNAVERFLMGSVSEHITRYAKCDVLVVRTEKNL
ncbi:universal stress protein [Fredinandcohnia sp. 179-A 10B2 NHS]|uniref:universal stress protein n=1 Tax=Fredinandcohnia sp. 179-A 10B2 NHS TaxID=3235176 RepID=UPI0039A05AF6